MNPSSDHLNDEILSALLDGDSDAAGGGAEGALDAAAHLQACDRCAGRQAELASARAAMAAAPVEPLDELARHRLVAAALAAADTTPAGEAPGVALLNGRSRWARRHPALIGSAAAVVLAILVGVPFVVGNGRSGDSRTLTAQGPLHDSASAFLGDLGDLSDRDRLRLRLSGVEVSDTYAAPPAEPGPSPAAGAPTAAPLAGALPGSGSLAGTAAPTDAAASTTAGPPGGGRTTGRRDEAGSATAEKAASEPQAADPAAASSGFAGDQSSRDRADTDTCVNALLNGPARGGRLTRAGTGTYRGRPAIVAAFELAGGTEAFIADRSGCAVLDRFPM